MESVPEYFYNTVLEDLYPNGQWILEKASLAQQIEKSRFGRELWPYLLGLVIILIFIEMALAYTGFTKRNGYLEDQVANANN
jgi:hypothetical protein